MMKMSWTIKLEPHALKVLKQLDRKTKKRLEAFVDRLEMIGNPRLLGEPLSGNLKGLWRYRVGDYRLICQIQDQEITILVLDLGHRREVYNFKK